MQLNYITLGDARKHFCIPKCISDEGSKLGSNFLVGHFIERKLSYSLVRTIAMRQRAKFGLVDVRLNDKEPTNIDAQ